MWVTVKRRYIQEFFLSPPRFTFRVVQLKFQYQKQRILPILQNLLNPIPLGPDMEGVNNNDITECLCLGP